MADDRCADRRPDHSHQPQRGLSMLEPGATSGEGAERAYVTKRGDTLKSVAESLYGSSARRDRLEAENAVIAGLNVRATLPPGVTLKAPADSA